MQNYIKDPWKYIDKNETQTDKNEVQTMEVIIVIHCLCYLWNEKKKLTSAMIESLAGVHCVMMRKPQS